MTALDAPDRLPARIELRARRSRWVAAVFRLLAALLTGVGVLLVSSLFGEGHLTIASVLFVTLALPFCWGVAVMVWKGAPFIGDRLSVARDAIRLMHSSTAGSFTKRVVAFDRTGARVRCEDADPAAHTWLAIPGLPTGAAAREAVLDRIEQSFSERPRRVADAILEAPSLAAIRADLGLDAVAAGPFRATAQGLSTDDALRLLDDRAASAAELLAAALVLAAWGGAGVRERIAALARDCNDVHFARLLRAIAKGEPAESQYQSLRSQAGPLERFFNGFSARLTVLVLLGYTSKLALGSTLTVGLLGGVALVAAIGEVRLRAAEHHLLARWGGLQAKAAAPWKHFLAVVGAAVAVRLLPAGSLPTALVPLMLYAAFWMPAALTLRRLDRAPTDATEAPATDDVTGVRIGEVAPASQEGVEASDAGAPMAASPRARECERG